MKRVIVSWVDITSFYDWNDEDGSDYDPFVFNTIGFLVSITDDFVTICSSEYVSGPEANEKKAFEHTKFPRGCVLKITTWPGD